MVYWAGIRAYKQKQIFPELVRPATSWHGKRGMRWEELLPKLQQLLKEESPPAKLVIHLGGNDLASTPTHKLERVIKEDLAQIYAWMPTTHIVWSDLTARLSYRYARDHAKVDKTRKALNNKIHVTVCQLGGSFIRHPAINRDAPNLFRPDGVHLRDCGNDILLLNWQTNIKGLMLYKSQ